MLFSTTQMRELTGMRREQLRHWRKVLPPLAGRDGRTDLYEFGEILALAALTELADRLGIPVSKLDACAADLFAMFSETDLADLPGEMFLSGGGVMSRGEPSDDPAYAALRPAKIMAMVRERLAPEQRAQLSLPL